jgi:hypothetical protein
MNNNRAYLFWLNRRDASYRDLPIDWQKSDSFGSWRYYNSDELFDFILAASKKWTFRPAIASAI